MEDKCIALPLGVYSYNPEQALDLIKSKPNAFLLLSLISFKKANDPYASYGLAKDEIYFSENDIKMAGHKPIFTPGKLRVAFKNLMEFGFIQVRKSEKIPKLKIIKILANPFFHVGVLS